VGRNYNIFGITHHFSLERQEIEEKLKKLQVSSLLLASINAAFHDYMGKKSGLPLWRLSGLNRDRVLILLMLL
jgi:L-alanine-DL-glutamate epimerase-like enolase superfamily enzyme